MGYYTHEFHYFLCLLPLPFAINDHRLAGFCTLGDPLDTRFRDMEAVRIYSFRMILPLQECPNPSQ